MNTLSELLAIKGMRTSLVASAAFLALFLLAQTITVVAGNFGRADAPTPNVITVTGQGQAVMAPDVAHVSFTVQNTAAAVADAQAATTKQTNAAIAAMKALGVADKDIKTESYNISPQYSYSNPCTPGYPVPTTMSGASAGAATICPEYQTSKITGYQVSQSITLTIRDLTKVGTVLQGVGTLGVQNVSGPDFGLDDSTAGYTAARADAIAKAKAQATLLASQLGVHLGKIVNFSESSGGYNYPVAYTMSAKDSGAPAPTIPVGENTYSASVSISYQIP